MSAVEAADGFSKTTMALWASCISMLWMEPQNAWQAGYALSLVSVSCLFLRAQPGKGLVQRSVGRANGYPTD